MYVFLRLLIRLRLSLVITHAVSRVLLFNKLQVMFLVIINKPLFLESFLDWVLFYLSLLNVTFNFRGPFNGSFTVSSEFYYWLFLSIFRDTFGVRGVHILKVWCFSTLHSVYFIVKNLISRSIYNTLITILLIGSLSALWLSNL